MQNNARPIAVNRPGEPGRSCKKKAWVWTCFNAKTLDGIDNLSAAVIKTRSIVFSSILAVDQKNSIVLSSLLTVYQKKVDH